MAHARQEIAFIRMADRNAETMAGFGKGTNGVAAEKAGAAENRDQGCAHVRFLSRESASGKGC
jgi:hypothetical protein